MALALLWQGGSSASADLLVIALVVVGSGIGVLGALYGARRGLREAHNDAEKRAIVRGGWLIGTGVLLFVVSMTVTPDEYRMWLWVPYGFGLPLMIRHVNRKQMEARAQGGSSDGSGAGTRE